MKKHLPISTNKTFQFVSVLLVSTVLGAGAASSGSLLGGTLGSVGGAVGGVTGTVGSTVGGTVSGVTSTVGSAVGGVTSAVGGIGGTVAGVAGPVKSTTATLGTLGSNGVLNVTAKSNILNGIYARLQLLTPEQLAKLCLTVGGSKSGCGWGGNPNILGLIDLKLRLLSDGRLVSLCINIGAGCGTTLPVTPPVTPPVVVVDQPTDHTPVFVGISGNNRISDPKRCMDVLRYPENFSDDIVKTCYLRMKRGG